MEILRLPQRLGLSSGRWCRRDRLAGKIIFYPQPFLAGQRLVPTIVYGRHKAWGLSGL
jgi:hypothetical protein